MSNYGKTWKDNIKEGLLMIVFGVPVGFGGLAWFQSMQDSSIQAVIINGIPLPPEILPLLLMGGFAAAFFGVIILLIIIIRRLVKKKTSYVDCFKE